jgi:hypothetical protein
MSESAILGWAERATFIFAGTVTGPGQSALRVLPSRPGLAVVRLDRAFLVNKVLGKLDGRPITVQLLPGADAKTPLHKGQKLIFFATGWVHGEQAAVTEFARLSADTKTEQEVEHAVALLPELHLSRRIASAVLIVHGTVSNIERATDAPRTASEHDPMWMRAVIAVKEVLKGKVAGEGANAIALLLFPGSRDIAFRTTPRPSQGQDAVFLLHSVSGQLPTNAHIAPDPADIQPHAQLATVKRLIEGANPPRPPG